jgi:hypothetical protein
MTPPARPARARFTVRRLMLAVALCGVGFGFPIGQFGRIAIRGDNAARLAVAYADAAAADRLLVETRGPGDPRAMQVGRRASYHLRMHGKWWLAYHHPWSSVAPDPPEPSLP